MGRRRRSVSGRPVAGSVLRREEGDVIETGPGRVDLRVYLTIQGLEAHACEGWDPVTGSELQSSGHTTAVV